MHRGLQLARHLRLDLLHAHRFHGLHVTIGAIMLTIIWLRTLRGTSRRRANFAFEAVAWYCTFVDVVWLGLFIFVYWI